MDKLESFGAKFALSTRCEKCELKDICDQKEMMLCGYFMSQNIESIDGGISFGVSSISDYGTSKIINKVKYDRVK